MINQNYYDEILGTREQRKTWKEEKAALAVAVNIEADKRVALVRALIEANALDYFQASLFQLAPIESSIANLGFPKP